MAATGATTHDDPFLLEFRGPHTPRIRIKTTPHTCEWVDKGQQGTCHPADLNGAKELLLVESRMAETIHE